MSHGEWRASGGGVRVSRTRRSRAMYVSASGSGRMSDERLPSAAASFGTLQISQLRGLSAMMRSSASFR